MNRKLIIAFAVLSVLIFFVSCEKEVGCGIDSACQTACEMEPIPDRTMVMTKGPVRYFFMKDTRQCKGVPTWEAAPFMTMEECEDCPCARLIPDTND